MGFSKRNFLFTLVILVALSVLLPAFPRADASVASGETSQEPSIPSDTLRYVCSRVSSNNFDDIISRLEKKSLDIVDVYFTISCGNDTSDSTILEYAVAMSSKEFVSDFMYYLKDRDEWDKTTYTDMILNHLDANGESLLDYIVRLKSNARDDSPREAIQWYMDYLKEKGARHSIELLQRGGNYVSPVTFPPVAPEE